MTITINTAANRITRAMREEAERMQSDNLNILGIFIILALLTVVPAFGLLTIRENDECNKLVITWTGLYVITHAVLGCLVPFSTFVKKKHVRAFFRRRFFRTRVHPA